MDDTSLHPHDDSPEERTFVAPIIGITDIYPDIFSEDGFTRFVSTGWYSPERHHPGFGISMARAAYRADHLIQVAPVDTNMRSPRYMEVLATAAGNIYGLYRNEAGGVPDRITAISLAGYEFVVAPVRVPPFGESFDPALQRGQRVSIRTTRQRIQDHDVYRFRYRRHLGDVEIGVFS